MEDYKFVLYPSQWERFKKAGYNMNQFILSKKLKTMDNPNKKKGSKFYQPRFVCEECGVKAHEFTYDNKFENPETGEVKRQMGKAIYKEGTCEACGEQKYTTDRKEFFYPNFHPKNFPYIAEGLASGRISNKILDKPVK